LYIFKLIYIARVGAGTGEKGPDPTGSATLWQTLSVIGFNFALKYLLNTRTYVTVP